MAVSSNKTGNFTLQINKTNEPALLLEWLAMRVENKNHIHKVRSNSDHFSIELNLNYTLHEEAAKFINDKSK